MKNLLLIASFTSLGLFPVKIDAQNAWINNAPGAEIIRIVITPDNPADPLESIADPLNQYVGTVSITFNNGSTTTAFLQTANHSPMTGGITIVDESYKYFAVYYCNANFPINICYGIALKLVSGRLCVGGFQYADQQSTDFIISLYDYGCFTPEKANQPLPGKNDLGILQRFTKDELLNFLLGKKPLPQSPKVPVCLSCPPWPGFSKDLELKLKDVKVKKYQITVKEIK